MGADAVLPRWQRDRMLALGAEDAVGGARGGAREAVGRSRQDAAADARDVEGLQRQLVPGARAGPGAVEDPGFGTLGQVDERGREVAGERGRADLVGDDLHLV